MISNKLGLKSLDTAKKLDVFSALIEETVTSYSFKDSPDSCPCDLGEVNTSILCANFPQEYP